MNKRNVLCAVVMLFSMGLVNASDGNIFKDLLTNPKKCFTAIRRDSLGPELYQNNMVGLLQAQCLQNDELLRRQDTIIGLLAQLVEAKKSNSSKAGKAPSQKKQPKKKPGLKGKQPIKKELGI